MTTLVQSFVTCLGGALLVVAVAGCQPDQPKKSSPPPEKVSADSTEKADTNAPTAPAAPSSSNESATPLPAAPAADSAEPAPTAKETSAANSKVPIGLPPLPIPDDNPPTPEKIELGKMLYFDKRLSKDGTVSCATCHDPKMAWAESRPTSEGIGKQLGNRNSPTVVNAAYATTQFWDGRAKSLEEQALGPIENPIEMGHNLDAMIADISKLDDYNARFQKVFGTPITKEGIAKAIAAFERTVLSGNSPYDRYKAGDESALTESQKRGLALFEDNCATCHAPPTFSNYRFYNAGVGWGKPSPDEGRKKVTGKDSDLGKFRAPALREAAKTAPYFHDGSEPALEGAVALMASGGKDNPNLSAALKAAREAKLTPENLKDLAAFLESLSGEFSIIDPPKLP
jgi:cytochrome c peroxidase